MHFKNQAPNLVTNIPGPKSTELRQKEEKLIANGLQGFAIYSGIVVDKAYGHIVKDVDGNEYLDIIGGIGVNGLGHSHPIFISEMQNQLEKASVGSFSSVPRISFFDEFQKVKLDNLSKIQLYSSGAAAVESALRLAKNKTEKYEFASFSGGFHGKTMGVLGLMGSDYKNSYGPFPQGNHILPYADCTNCPFKLKHPSCSMACLDACRSQLKANVTRGLAAIILEPMQGTAGNLIPPVEFVKGVREMAKEFDALFISDEMITGFGRTGKFWGSSHFDIVPDIMTVGKQFGGGYPISAVITTEEINMALPWGNPSGSSSSYGGNPLASQAALTALRIIKEESLVDNSKNMGKYFKDKLLELADTYSFIKNVRGEGLFMGLDLVDPKTNKLLSKDFCMELFKSFVGEGLLTMSYTPRFRIQPSMTIDKDTIDNVVTVMNKVFSKISL